jgi:FAD/FMN-containing dehydrogenase
MTDVVLRTGSGEKITLPEEAVAALGSRTRGRLATPSDGDYDVARAVWNGMVDKRPALIGQCAGVTDVVACVQFARQHNLLVAVRGGGHNVAGVGVCDGGLMIDLSPMRGVRVDPVARTVRAEGGVTIGDLDHETQAFGLAVPMGVVTATGIAGLTLGGGLGWVRRRYGLSCDNLLSADVVTADGELVVASPDTEPELFWALQGGGGNFGVVTSFEFQAHPVGPDVFLAVVFHAGADAVEGLRFYREWAPEAADEISAFAVLWHGPEIEEIPAEHRGQPVLVFAVMHCGDPAEGEAALRSLREFGTPIADLSGTMPYLEAQQFFDADYPAHEMRYYWKSRYLNELPDDLIDTLVRLNAASPSHHSTVDFWQLGGAMGRVAADATAFGDRSAPFLIGIEANWESPDDDDACIGWGREVFRVLEPFSTGREYVNFPGLYEDNQRMVRDTFGGNLDRLRAVKRRYDPTNLFRLNHNIPPD